MNREGDPKEWLRYAENDRSAAQHILAYGDYENCAFHCQQAVEKLLKAIIVKQTGQRPPHVHDLLTLLRKIKGLQITEDLERAIGRIDAYYVGSRYPLDVVDEGAFKRPLAEAAVQQTEALFQWFLAQINFDDT